MMTVDLLSEQEAAARASGQLQRAMISGTVLLAQGLVRVRFVERNDSQGRYFVVIGLYPDCDDAGDAIGVIDHAGRFLSPDLAGALI